MKFLIQRVSGASVKVDGVTVASIGRGLCVLIGIAEDDTRSIADKMVKKLIGLRIFEDDRGKTNTDITEAGGGLLLVSQFTLYADMRHGNRPSFIRAASPLPAEELYGYIVGECRSTYADRVKKVEEGVFGADMELSLVNDGPFTVLLDSEDLVTGASPGAGGNGRRSF